jgi:hypothetical protein
VVAPVPTFAGEPTARLDSRHTIALLPYLDGVSGRWGEPLDPAERHPALELLASLHGTDVTVQAPGRRSTDVPGGRQPGTRSQCPS